MATPKRAAASPSSRVIRNRLSTFARQLDDRPSDQKTTDHCPWPRKRNRITSGNVIELRVSATTRYCVEEFAQYTYIVDIYDVLGNLTMFMACCSVLIFKIRRVMSLRWYIKLIAGYTPIHNLQKGISFFFFSTIIADRITEGSRKEYQPLVKKSSIWYPSRTRFVFCSGKALTTRTWQQKRCEHNVSFDVIKLPARERDGANHMIENHPRVRGQIPWHNFLSFSFFSCTQTQSALGEPNRYLSQDN